MRTILFTLFFLSAFTVRAQQAGKAYYNYTFRLIGGVETLIVPEGNQYIILKNQLGMLGHTFTDTLEVTSGGLSGKYVNMHFTEKGIVVQSKRSNEIAKARKYKEYDVCDPFVNKLRNEYYGNSLSHEVYRLADEKIGRFNKEWQARPLHLTDLLLNDEHNDRLSTSLSDYCHNEFKLMADSVQQIKIELISSIMAKKQLRKEKFMADSVSISTESISKLLPEIDDCRTDQELFVYLAEKEPHKLMEALEIATKTYPAHYFPVYHLPESIDTSLGKQNLLSITPKSKHTEEMMNRIKKYWN